MNERAGNAGQRALRATESTNSGQKRKIRPVSQERSRVAKTVSEREPTTTGAENVLNAPLACDKVRAPKADFSIRLARLMAERFLPTR